MSADENDCLYLVFGARQNDGGGQSTKSSQPIAFVRLKLVTLYDNSLIADDYPEVGQYSLREDSLFEFGGIWRSTRHSHLVRRH